MSERARPSLFEPSVRRRVRSALERDALDRPSAVEREVLGALGSNARAVAFARQMYDEAYELGFRAGHFRGFCNALLFVLAAVVVACCIWWLS